MRKPTLLGAVACVLTAAGGYMLLISPQSAATAELQAQLDTAHASNQAAAAQIPALKTELENISGDVDALRALSQQVPPTIDLPTLYAELDAVAASVGDGVTVSNVSVTVPALLTATDPNAVPADPAQADPNAAAEQPVDPNAPVVDPTQQANPEPAAVLASYEVTMTVEATPEQAASFLQALGATKRLNVVSTSGVSGGAGDSAGALNVTATFYLQQVDVDGLAAQIEALASGQGITAAGEPAQEPTETAADS